MISVYFLSILLTLLLFQPKSTNAQNILLKSDGNKISDKDNMAVLNPEDSSKLQILEKQFRKNRNFTYIPPPGINYKIEKFKPDKSVGYKMLFYRCGPKYNPLSILKNFDEHKVPPDLLKKHLKKFIPKHFLH